MEKKSRKQNNFANPHRLPAAALISTRLETMPINKTPHDHLQENESLSIEHFLEQMAKLLRKKMRMPMNFWKVSRYSFAGFPSAF